MPQTQTKNSRRTQSTSAQPQRLLLGSIRMSPLMYGSLRYIATLHPNGALDLSELSGLKQTQIRSFKTRGWIKETRDERGIEITREGRAGLKAFEENDQFFRGAAVMRFSSLLKLKLPELGAIEPKPAVSAASVVQMRQRAR